ncbi:MAG: PSD1 and planctomycete cytochrome C domain-containing protein, partial [Planctomycetaceae bacterium]
MDFLRDVAPILQRHCLVCHNERDQRGQFSLHSKQAALRGGENGQSIVPGDPDTSYLLDLVTPSDGTAEMPKNAPPLKPDQIDTLQQWIARGADWPEAVALKAPAVWSLKPLTRPEVPSTAAVSDAFPVRNPIDGFIAARHRAAGLVPAPQADRRTLIRRLYLDITGLLPSPEAVDAFVTDEEPKAWDRLVDELLKSPHYGERWGRYWLDLARYADSEGYLGDALRPHAWVFREWVIQAINRDLPFDQFTIEQLAGDLLDEPAPDQRIATGFHRNTLRNTEAGVDLELYRTKEIVDRVNTTGMVWLGLTLGCAECHDHKHDPISQTEFYRLYAFFNNADETGVPVTRSWEVAAYEAALRTWEPEWNELVAGLQPYQNDDLTEKHKATVSKVFSVSSRSIDWKPILNFYRTKADGWEKLKASVDAHLKTKPSKPATKARAFAKRTKNRRSTFVHLRGIYTRHGNKVDPGTPSILPDITARGEEPDRLDLARWLFHEQNPLTARVAVNRIWQHLFGQGLVSTPNDFGNKGARPTHPKLLDWLATEYRRRGWSRTEMIRLIATSSTYRLASRSNAVPAQRQTGNQLLWRQNSYRVSAEIVRDLHLAASGLLNRTVGRRGIRPPLPAFVTEVGRSVKWPVSAGSERYRRGMYIFFKRTVP